MLNSRLVVLFIVVLVALMGGCSSGSEAVTVQTEGSSVSTPSGQAAYYEEVFRGRQHVEGAVNPIDDKLGIRLVPRGIPTEAPVPTPRTGGMVTAVPVLMYHYIRVNPDPSDKLGEDLSVRPEVFEEELRWLASHGYHALTLRSVVSSWKGNKPLPDKPVVLTFDDGYEDVYTVALPAMQRYGFVGVAFAVSSFVGRPGYASAEQLRKLQEQGWEIGAHSADHVDLTKLGSEALRRQVEGSREALTILLGERPRSFSYPSGRWNQTVERAVAGAGFEAAVTTQWGVARPTMDTLSLPRLRIRGTTTLRSFNQIMLAVEP